jgi:hypothetical protein
VTVTVEIAVFITADGNRIVDEIKGIIWAAWWESDVPSSDLSSII